MAPVVILAIPDYVENIAYVEQETIMGLIRATAYPYINNDTLDIDLLIEYNLSAIGLEMSKTDTVYSMDSVWVETPIPFIEEPVVVAGGTLLGIAILYGIVESIKGIGK